MSEYEREDGDESRGRPILVYGEDGKTPRAFGGVHVYTEDELAELARRDIMPGTPGAEEDLRRRVARRLIEALKTADPTAYIHDMDGEKGLLDTERTIDGHFVLRGVVDAILDEAGRRLGEDPSGD